MKNTFLFLLVLSLLATGCSSKTSDPILAASDPSLFKDYWYQGQAELTRYELDQARYGENHPGDAVLIFVTEDFLEEKQVKRDHGEDAAYSVLKLNATRKFDTGLYPYSLMTSVFTRVDHAQPETPKVSFSAQEWCGHVYMQLNRRGKRIQGALHSYFQNEGDRELKLPNVPLEDGIWTTLRIAPNRLPIGKLSMIPALSYLRLKHVEAKAYDVKATLQEASDADFAPNRIYRYRLEYKGIDRILEVFFEKEQPHRILGWREMEGGEKGTVTTAHRTHEMKTDYWSKNKPEDTRLRQQLGL